MVIGFMTFAPEWLTGSLNLNTSNAMYTYVLSPILPLFSDIPLQLCRALSISSLFASCAISISLPLFSPIHQFFPSQPSIEARRNRQRHNLKSLKLANPLSFTSNFPPILAGYISFSSTLYGFGFLRGSYTSHTMKSSVA